MKKKMILLPGYGTCPYVNNSISNIPKDHTSDLIEKRPYTIASGAVHFTGNRVPCRGQYSSSSIILAKPKSQILAILFSPINTFLAAKSLKKKYQ